MKFIGAQRHGSRISNQVTDTMYEYCRWLSVKNHDRNCLANIELTDAAEKMGYAWGNNPHGPVPNALACLAVNME